MPNFEMRDPENNSFDVSSQRLAGCGKGEGASLPLPSTPPDSEMIVTACHWSWGNWTSPPATIRQGYLDGRPNDEA
ncbi:hypothetical protein [Pseudomonas fluorescens]|uniref:hypothetical protein n=1 Tax=Pseudomonas fluorescens TaxID=294 RepID=UPI00124311F9|nr:hypothetical protein [Pseudomonas fluorescens]